MNKKAKLEVMQIVGIIIVLVSIAVLIGVILFFQKTNQLDPIETSNNLNSYDYIIQNYSGQEILYPNSSMTPGDIQTNDLNIICYDYYSKLLVAVPDNITNQVYTEYNITVHKLHQYEIDHFYPLSLGGSGDIKNLWPQPVTYPGYKEKDYVQLYLRDQVCNHGMNLSEARSIVTGDWYSYYLTVKDKKLNIFQ